MSINAIKESDYVKGKEYWSDIEPTVNGMLGGFDFVSETDVHSSSRFLSQYFSLIEPQTEKRLNSSSNKEAKNKLTSDNARAKRCLDCGAGIGRVTKHLLLNYFDKVDLLEQNVKFTNEARKYIGERLFDERIDSVYNCSLHEFSPPANVKYDLIWIQWVIGYLTDNDLINFLIKCKSLLNTNGLIIIKDNHTSSDECDADTADGSVTRSLKLIKKIFRLANLRLIEARRQVKFPKGLYPVKMFALK